MALFTVPAIELLGAAERLALEQRLRQWLVCRSLQKPFFMPPRLAFRRGVADPLRAARHCAGDDPGGAAVAAPQAA